MTQPPKYTPAQISTYLQLLSPSPSPGVDIDLTRLLQTSPPQSPDEELHHLSILQKYHLAAVPFENLSLHYSAAPRDLSIDAGDLYEKIVGRRRGGYCMELNGFFNAVLRGLGFGVYSAGARVSDAVSGGSGEGFNGWSHMVNIVTLSDGKKYMVDVGFGANGPTRPLPLEAGRIWEGISPQEIRLVYENIPTNTDPGQRLWIYQYRDSSKDEWIPAYCFTELEFLPRDYNVMNFWTSHNPESFFLKQVVIVKMIMEEEKLVGTLILFSDTVKRKVGGKTETLEICKSEDDRVKAVQRWFGIELGDDERRGIRGLKSELKVNP